MVLGPALKLVQPRHVTGDSYVKRDEAPWISEMYGYVIAAAEARIDTKLVRGVVQYTDGRNGAPAEQGTLAPSTLPCDVAPGFEIVSAESGKGFEDGEDGCKARRL
eukprot:scaffold215133_cov39-Tisochrysis_lutea.AAC.3